MDITIKSSLDVLSDFDVYAYTLNCNVLDEKISNFDVICDEIKSQYDIKDLLLIDEIKDARSAYKTLKADPNRVHLSCEGLLRRVLKGNSLYNVNNVVDYGNLISLKLKRSVCVCDYDKLAGNVVIEKCPLGVKYYGINRGEIRVDNLPIYKDDISYFGNPTSDIERTMITSSTKRILVMIINFSKDFDKEYIIKKISEIDEKCNINSFIDLSSKIEINVKRER